MSTDTTVPDVNGGARDQLRAFVERIERVEEEIKALNDDKSDIYKEAASVGFDKKTLKKVVARRKVDADQRHEEDALFEMYWDAIHGVGLVHARARENIREFDAETGGILDGETNAKLIATVATGMQTEIGRKALVKALDVMIEHEEAEERRSDAGLNIITKHTEIAASDGHSPAVPPLAGSARDEESAVSKSEMDRATEGSFETGSEAAEKGREAIPAGPEGVDLNHAGAGESPATEITIPSAERVSPVEGGRAAANAGGIDVEGSATRAGLADPASNAGEGAACVLPDNSGVTMEYVPPCGMKRPPFAQCFPDLSKADYDKLERDIAANRVKAPIIRKGDVILDGWNRYTIARKYGMDYPVQEYTGTDVLLDVIERQRASRNFTPAQERKIAADLAKDLPGRADDIMAAFGLAEALEASA